MTRLQKILCCTVSVVLTIAVAHAADEPVVPAATAPASAPPPATPSAGTPAGPQASTSATIELNKLETYDKGCRAYMVVNNPTDMNYQAFKLDLVLFQTDGVIGRRFALDLAPLRAQKKTVKLFELDGVACDKIGSFLINDVMDCKADAGPAENCLQRMTTSSLTTVKFSK